MTYKEWAERSLFPRTKKTKSGCVEWQGCLNSAGYGVLGCSEFGTMLAHRLSFLVLVKDPGSLCVLHRCDNPKCVNPAHLFLGTRADNIADKMRKGREVYGDKKARKGEKHGRSKLKAVDVENIRYLYAEGMETQTDLARFYSVTQACVSLICRGRRWLHIL